MKVDREKMQLARARHGWSIGKTADEAGVSNNSALRAEHEEEVNVTTVHKLATALGVDVRDLVKEPVLAGKVEAPLKADERRLLAYIRPWFSLLDSYSERLERVADTPVFDSETFRKADLYVEDAISAMHLVLREASREGIDLTAGPVARELEAAEQRLATAKLAAVQASSGHLSESEYQQAARRQREVTEKLTDLLSA